MNTAEHEYMNIARPPPPPLPPLPTPINDTDYATVLNELFDCNFWNKNLTIV